MSILIDNICKNFGSFTALNHVNLEVKSGSVTALIGPSGSGKSTLLRIIAGLETPDTGKIWLSGKDANFYSVQSRNIGFVFQNYALFNNMTVYDNIAFGLELRSVPKKQIPDKIAKLLDLIQLKGLETRYPRQLSGGQRQRIAFARALAIQPKVLLLDEPFGALDAKVRRELRSWLRNLHQQFSVTTILVTHDQQEAMEVADEIVIFNRGRIEQIGKPQEVYDVPATSFVTEFLGDANIIPNHKIGLRKQFYNFNQNLDKVCDSGFSYLRSHQIVVQIEKSKGFWPANLINIVYLNAHVILYLELKYEDLKLKVEMSQKKFKELNIVDQKTILYLNFLI
jgi:sulfate transport system ATP-binding protein